MLTRALLATILPAAEFIFIPKTELTGCTVTSKRLRSMITEPSVHDRSFPVPLSPMIIIQRNNLVLKLSLLDDWVLLGVSLLQTTTNASVGQALFNSFYTKSGQLSLISLSTENFSFTVDLQTTSVKPQVIVPKIKKINPKTINTKAISSATFKQTLGPCVSP